MTVDDLHRAVRARYREIVKRGSDRAEAFREAVALLRSQRPDWSEADAARAVTRMLEEESGC